MKKKIGLSLLFVSGILAVYLICFLGGTVRFENLCVSGEQYRLIMDSNRMESGEELLDALVFDEQQLFFDASSQTFYYSLEEGSSSAYNPRVEVRAALDDVRVAVLGERITSEDVQAAKKFRLAAYNGVTYREYTLVCTTLPLMNIACDTEIGDEDMPVQMTLFDNRKGAAQRFTESDGEMHIRGGSTRTYPKKGYKLSLTKESLGGNTRLNKVSLLGMRQDDDWILYAAYNDPEKIRNVFSSALWKNTCAMNNAFGIDNGMEYRYVELFLNGEYWGLYALGYPIDDLQLSIDVSQGERLYKKSTWDSEDYMLSLPDAGVDGYSTSEADDAWVSLKEHFATLHADWADAERMYEGIDIDNAVDMYLFLNLIQGIDHVGVINSLSAKNLFLSFHKKDGQEKVLYTPWDMDITWGLQWTGDAETNLCKAYGVPSSQNTVWGLGNLPSLILNGDEEIWQLILEKYWTLRKDLWSEENLNTLIDGYEKDIYGSGAFLRDRERWQDGSYWDAERGLTDFREFVAERLQETDDYYRRVETLVLGENATTNVYIVRSAQYKDFLQSDFLVAVNDRGFLENSDYGEFLSYIGVNTAQLTDTVKYAVVRGSDGKVEYFESLSLPEGVRTCIGTVRMEEDTEPSGSCRIFVDDVLWRSLDLRGQNGIEVMLDNHKMQEALRFDFSKEYVMWSKLCEDGEPARWCTEVRNNGCDVLIEIVNHDVINDKRFAALLEGFGVDTQSVAQNTDFIAVLNTGGGHLTILNDSHESGTRCDTVLGAFSIFYNDEGGYGVYLNGNECILVQPQENEYADVRVSVFYREPYEVVWCPEFCYD